MKVDIIAVGKVKEKFYRDAIDEFAKRLGKYCKLQIIEVADEKTPDGAGEALEEQIKAREAERILKNIKHMWLWIIRLQKGIIRTRKTMVLW